MLSQSIVVPALANGVPGTPLNMGVFQYGDSVTVQLPAAAGAGDGVQFYAGNISNATSTAQLVPLGEIPASSGDGRVPSAAFGVSYLYLYAVRTSIATAGALTATVVGQETAGTSGGSGNPNAFLQNGNAFGATNNLGPTDGNALNIGSGWGAANTTAISIDTSVAGPVTLGHTNATSVAIGSGISTTTIDGGSGVSHFLVAAGGQLNVGSGTAVFPAVADSIQIRARSGGPVTIATAGATGVTITGGTGTSSWTIGAGGTLQLAADADAHTVQIATGAAAQTRTMGASTTTSTTPIAFGSGGLGVGAAAPGASGIAIDTPAAGAITVGAANATSFILSTGAVPQFEASAAGVEIGGGGTAGVTIAAGPVQPTVNSTLTLGTTAAGSILITGGTGSNNWTVGAGSTLNLAADAHAHTINIGTGAAAQTIGVGSSDAATVVTVTGGAQVLTMGLNNVTLTWAGGGAGIGAAAPGGFGLALDTPVAGAVTIGATTATSVNIGNATAGFLATLNGPVARNTIPIANLAGGGAIGTAAATVNISDYFTVNQTTAAQTLTIPSPTGAAAVEGRVIYVKNIGTASFTMLGKVVAASAANSQSLLIAAWDNTGARWVTTI